MPIDDPLLPRDDVSVIGAEDIYQGALNTARLGGLLFPGSTVPRRELEEQYGRRPEQALNIGFGPGDFRIDATGAVQLPQFTVGRGADIGMFDYNFGNTVGSGIFGLVSV